MVALFTAILLLDITKQGQDSVGKEITDNSSVIDRYETIYTPQEQKYTTIKGSDIISNIVTNIEPYSEKQLKEDIISIKIDSYDITGNMLLDIRNKKKDAVKTAIREIAANSEYRCEYYYDDNYTLKSVHYVKVIGD